MDFQPLSIEYPFEEKVEEGISLANDPQEILSTVTQSSVESTHINLEYIFGASDCIYEMHGITTTKPSDFHWPNLDEVTYLNDIKTFDATPLEYTVHNLMPLTDQCGGATSPELLTNDGDSFFSTSDSTSSIEHKQSSSPKQQSIERYSNVAPLQNTDPSQSNLSFDHLNETLRAFDANKEHLIQWNDVPDLISSSNEDDFNVTNEIDIDIETISFLQSVLSEIDSDATGQIKHSDNTSTDNPRYESIKGKPVSSYQNAEQKPTLFDSEHCVANKAAYHQS